MLSLSGCTSPVTLRPPHHLLSLMQLWQLSCPRGPGLCAPHSCGADVSRGLQFPGQQLLPSIRPSPPAWSASQGPRETTRAGVGSPEGDGKRETAMGTDPEPLGCRARDQPRFPRVHPKPGVLPHFAGVEPSLGSSFSGLGLRGRKEFDMRNSWNPSLTLAQVSLCCEGGLAGGGGSCGQPWPSRSFSLGLASA